MKISTDKEILAAAKECSDAYREEAKQEGMFVVAEWKEIAFFIKGAEWMQERQQKIDIEKAVKFVHDNYDGYDGADFERELRKAMEE